MAVTFPLTIVSVSDTRSTISLNEDAIMRALLTVERERSPRADLQSAPGRLRGPARPAKGPVCQELAVLGMLRRRAKHPPERSQETQFWS